MHHKRIKRRTFLKVSAAAGIAGGAGIFLFNDHIDHFLQTSLKNTIDFKSLPDLQDTEKKLYPINLDHEKRIHPGDLPIYSGSSADTLALTRYYPQLAYSRNNPAKIQIINIHHQDFPNLHTRLTNRAVVHDSVFPFIDIPQRFIVPWAPLFAKWTPIKTLKHQLFDTLKEQVVYVKDEGSDSVALFGNKARKYEFSFPFCLQTGAKSLVTFGSLSSNHCVFTALTAACAQLGKCFNGNDPKVLVNLYPQRFYPHIIHKLKYLLALGTGIRFLPNDMEVAYSILANQTREKFSQDDDLAYCEPGGSNPLTTLSHVNAIFELNEQIADGSSVLHEPPDFIYAPLGSGGTCMGLVFGCHLLGWKTKVVGTTSQDKSLWTRTLVFGNPTRPFLVQNAARLLRKTIDLFAFLELPGSAMSRLDPDTILEKHFCFDNNTWKPAYGIPSDRTSAVIDQFSDGRKLTLDATFSGKSFTTLLDHIQDSRLAGKKVLFWNTHQRFDFMAHKKVKDTDLSLLPVELQDYLTQNGLS